MVYDRYFNNALAIFTAFTAEMCPEVVFDWQKLYTTDFDCTSEYEGISVHSNGNTNIVRISNHDYDDNCSYVSVFNMNTQRWETVRKYGYPLICGEHGLFLAMKSNYSPYYSRDGITWESCGELPEIYTIPSGYKRISCVALNGTGGIIVPCTMFDVPLWYKGNITTSKNWKTTESEFTKFESIEYHNGSYISGSKRDLHGDDGGIYISSNGACWEKTLSLPNGCSEDYYLNNFIELRSINGKLFVKTECCTKNGYPSTYGIGVFDESLTSYTDVMTFPMKAGYVEKFYKVPKLSSLIYVPSMERYLMFGKNTVYSSEDGYTWKTNMQGGLSDAVGSVVYIEGQGIYVNLAEKSNYIYFAPCP